MPDAAKPEQDGPPLGWPQTLALALAFGVIGTLFGQYRFGFVNHVEQLPPIMRALDPAALPGDAMVDGLCAFGPRHYYVTLIVMLARIIPVWAVYAVLTVLAHSGTALVTLLAARSIFRSRLAAMFAAALVVSVASVGIGGAAHLVRPQLVPQTLATPALLAALWMGFTLRPYRAAALAACGCLFHPLAGAHTGMLALATCGLGHWMTPEPKRSRPRIRRVLPTLCAGLLLAGFVYCCWMLPDGEHAYDLDFMLDFASFRSPHHHLPGQFSLGAYAAFGCFSAAIAWAWLSWRAEPGTDRRLAVRIAACLLAVYCLLGCGYFFVELLPTRTFLMAQTFRLVFVIKWIGLMLIAAAAARMLARALPKRSALAAVMLMLGTGPFQPAFALGGQIIDFILNRASKRRTLAANICAVFVGMGGLLLWRAECTNEILALLVCGLLVAWCHSVQPRFATHGALLAAATCLGLVALGRGQVQAGAVPLLGPYQPVLTLAEGRDSNTEIAIFAREHTPAGSVFLTPPYFGRFRLEACRSVVVDFKCMPYDAEGYAAWRQRLADCYGDVTETAEQAVIVMKNHYRWITPETIHRVAGKYGADFAVLFRHTPTDWPVRYQDERYKLVAIPSSRISLEGQRAGNAPVPRRSCSALFSSASHLSAAETSRCIEHIQ